MNFRKLMITTCCVAALAAFFQTAQAAAAGGGGSDLRGVTQNWDKVLPAEPGAGCPNWSTRFTCVMNNAAVRDNETGLVWQHPLPEAMSWSDAKRACINSATGNRKGWRLPAVTELASLIDTSNPSAVKLPAYIPFIYVPTVAGYWTSTQEGFDTATNPAPAYFVRFQDSQTGPAGTIGTVHKTATDRVVWCVRGGDALGALY